MIKETKLKINMSYRNITYYKSKGYNVSLHDIVEIKIEDVNKNSKIQITAICELCGSENKVSIYKYYKNKERHNYYGCRKCSRKKFKLTNLDKFGVDNPMKNEEIKNKIEKTNLKKYGVKTTLLEKNTKEKRKNTLLEKYGVEEPLSSKEIRDKGKKAMLKKYGVEHYSKSNYFYDNTYKCWKREAIKKLNKYEIADFKLKKNRTIDIKCDNNHTHYFNITTKNLYQRKEIQHNILCTICNSVISQKQSGKELQVLNFIKENYNNHISENNKDIISELDIYLPDLNLAFEFNGVYWHSDLYKNKNYHLNKTEQCENQGIQLIHIWENDWVYKQDIVKSMILNKLGKTPNKIYGRKTKVKEIADNKIVRKFLEKNHIQGFVGSKIKLGLYYKKELVSLMTFGKRRITMGMKKSKKGEFELLRFCNKLNTNVLGGASKLFKYFIDNYIPTEITTYADRSHSNGKLYETLGFKFVSKTPPNYNYYDSKCNKYNRFNFRKNLLVKNGYDINKTEFQIMDELGYLRVFNSGNLKYHLII